MTSELVDGVVGILKNVQIISEVMKDNLYSKVPLSSLKNVYIGDLKSLNDGNTLSVLFIEEGYSEIT